MRESKITSVQETVGQRCVLFWCRTLSVLLIPLSTTPLQVDWSQILENLIRLKVFSKLKK
jgi:hypothetical protein